LKKSSLKVAIAQWSIRKGDIDYNISKLKTFAERAKEQNADLLQIPEMWYFGYDYDNFNKFGSDLSEGAFKGMSQLAKEFQIAICGTSAKNEGDVFFNIMTFFDQFGELKFSYDKLHLFGPMGETDNFKNGDKIVVGEWEDWKIGLSICYDLRFPELFRKQVIQGAKLILVSAQWPITRIEHWDLLLRARAIENQTFVIGCNRIGSNEDYTFSGHSAIIAPDGKVIIKADDSEGIWLAEIKIEDLYKYRKSLPFLYDIRNDLT